MDVIRRRPRRMAKWSYIALAALAVLGTSAWGVHGIGNRSGAVVDKSTLVTDVARQGTLVRSISAQGTFTPDRVRVVAATQSGVVNQLFVKPGSYVTSGTIVAQMQNPAFA